MNRAIATVLLAAMAAGAATSTRTPWSLQPFEALPAPEHPSRASDLAWLDNGLAAGLFATTPEVAGIVSAPHFQVSYGQRTLDLEDPSSGDELYSRTDRTLRLGTALATSQLGLGSDAFDIAVGASFRRDKIGYDTTPAGKRRGNRQSADLSAGVRLWSYRLTGELVDAIDAGSDEGTASDPYWAVDAGFVDPSLPQFGARLSLPLRTGGEGGLQLGVGRSFREALSFSAEIGTTYRYESDTLGGLRHLVRRSLEVALGTGIRFRPAQPSDPAWIRNVADPFGGAGLLRHVRLDLIGRWDLVRGSGGAAVSVGREF